MLDTFTWLLASLAVITWVAFVAPNSLCVPLLLIGLLALVAVLSTLGRSRSTEDLIKVLDAITTLIRGRPKP